MIKKIIKILNKHKDNFIIHNLSTKSVNHIYIIEKCGKSLCRIYWFSDNNDNIYIDNLSVENKYRNKGLASELLDLFIMISEELKIDSYLWVEKDTWMIDWYEKKGYVYHGEYKEENAIWMKRKTKNKKKYGYTKENKN